MTDLALDLIIISTKDNKDILKNKLRYRQNTREKMDNSENKEQPKEI
jgi:hypothetical protein